MSTQPQEHRKWWTTFNYEVRELEGFKVLGSNTTLWCFPKSSPTGGDSYSLEGDKIFESKQLAVASAKSEVLSQMEFLTKKAEKLSKEEQDRQMMWLSDQGVVTSVECVRSEHTNTLWRTMPYHDLKREGTELFISRDDAVRVALEWLDKHDAEMLKRRLALPPPPSK